MLISTTTQRDRTRTTSTTLRHAGQASVHGHWGELLQGSFRDRDGAIVRGLATLRSPIFESWAHFVPTDGKTLTADPIHCRKALQAAANTLSYLGVTGRGGHLMVTSHTPIGIGAGSSTTDVVATIEAVANACEAKLSQLEIAALAVETEIAVDPIMLRPCPEVLFAHRQGTVLEYFSGWLPQVHVIGFTDGDPVDTLAHPPARYSRTQVDEFEDLRRQLRHAIATRDRALVGEVATRSAMINQAYLPKPSLELALDIVREAGAVGLSVSHSGSAVGLLFDPSRDDSAMRTYRARHLLDIAGFGPHWSFMTGWPG